MLARVARAQEQLIGNWDVLSTMTPHDYSQIRPYLGRSSGFQSAQYRLMEFMLGGRDPAMVTMHEATPEVAAELRAELQRPSLYDEALRLLARRGFAVPAAVLERGLERPHDCHPDIVEAWAQVYRAPETYWDLYELAEKLVDLEYHFQRWRFGHLKTVERIIGFKRGTGGTAGVPYLESVLKKGFFPELLAVRTRDLMQPSLASPKAPRSSTTRRPAGRHTRRRVRAAAGAGLPRRQFARRAAAGHRGAARRSGAARMGRGAGAQLERAPTGSACRARSARRSRR